MTIRQRLFVDQQVLTAAQVNDNLRDITVIDNVSELSSVDSGIYAVFCKQNRRLYTRQADTGSVWELYAAMTVSGATVPTATSQLRMHVHNVVANVSNTAGGVAISLGTTYSTAVASVMITPGDNTGPLGYVVVIGNQITLTTVGAIAYQPNGAVLPNGQPFRVNVLSVGW